MTHFKIGKRLLPPERMSGPWTANPWLSSRRIDPRAQDGTAGGHGSALSPLPPPPPIDVGSGVGTTREQRQKEYRERRAALGTWEDEGGSTTLR